jgi:uncharacterized metal-binding protein YceD (DUF177 family)
MMTTAEVPLPIEFSRTIEISKIPDVPEHLHWKATPEECAALQKRLMLRGLKDFVVDYDMKRMHDRRIFQVTGTVQAHVVQECVVSLEDAPDDVKDTFVVYLKPYRPHDKEPEEISLEDEDVIEYNPTDKINLGEIATQYLSLALDPYPRAPGHKSL